MEIPLALLADYANVTAEGKLNIMGIFDSILVPGKFPVTHVQMRLIFRLRISVAERGQTKTLEIKLVDSDGKSLLSLTAPLQIPQNLPLQQPDIPQILELNNLVLPKQGDYAFHILVNGEDKTRVPFKVAVLPRPDPELPRQV